MDVQVSGQQGAQARASGSPASRSSRSRTGASRTPEPKLRFVSILAPPGDAAATSPTPDAPGCFADLRLDQVVETLIEGRDEYDLAPFYHAPARELATIEYRHEVVRDLEQPEVLSAVGRFAEAMRGVRRGVARAERLRYPRERQARWLDAIAGYGDAVRDLAAELGRLPLGSAGFHALADHLARLVGSDAFVAMLDANDALRQRLSAVRYRLRVIGNRVVVHRFSDEPDYSADVLSTFQKFKQGAPREYQFDQRHEPQMNHVEAEILDRVARLHADLFAELAAHADRYAEFVDPLIGRFDREVQFYVAYLEQIERLRAVGLRFCLPEVSDNSREAAGEEVFDLALANRLSGEGIGVITNDFALSGAERILVVTGPNQGGKTTFARTVGQLHYLAGLGLPVPGTMARTFLVDAIYTHFEREEDLEKQRSKLEDDLVRIRAILQRATPDSLLVLNESLSSTTVADAAALGREIVRRIVALGPLCVFVTFLDELASLYPEVVSMVATVDASDPARRTFRLVRRPADGRAYAAAIAAKFGLTYDDVRERIGG